MQSYSLNVQFKVRDKIVEPEQRNKIIHLMQLNAFIMMVWIDLRKFMKTGLKCAVFTGLRT